MKNKTAIISYGDVQTELYKLMKSKEIECEKVSLVNTGVLRPYLESFEKIILPFPSKKENLGFISEKNQKVTDFFTKGQLIIGGLFEDEIKNELEEAGIDYIDYFTYEPYVLKNAYLTSQGCVRLLLENSKDYIGGKHALITGFGRIGKSLALMLKSLGVKVFVAVRSEIQAADACSLGFDVFRISQLKGVLFYFDFIFNTVPGRIISERDVSRIRDDAIYFEVASSPFGADEKAFRDSGKNHVKASALPGKFYPNAVAQNILNMIIFNDELSKGEK